MSRRWIVDYALATRLAVLVCLVGLPSAALGQSFGVELHNTLMPATGAMGGAGIAQPQDLTSSLNGNPATLTQFAGTQFLFSAIPSCL